LIEDYGEEIDQILDTFLEENFVKTCGLLQVSLGGGDGFNMCSTTKLANPKLSPETFAQTAVIELSVTQFVLEEQLLNFVMLREKDKLENEFQGLLDQVGELNQVSVDLKTISGSILQ
jgi:dynein heavy chain